MARTPTLALLLTAGLALPAGVAAITDATAKDDLSVMVLPRPDLGALSGGLEIDEDSGPQSNEAEAEDDSSTPRLCRTPAELAAAGRVGGFALGYQDRDLSNLKQGGGVIQAGTGVERFRDDAAASAGMAAALADEQLLVGLVYGGVTVEAVEPFAVAVPGADEANAWRFRGRVGSFGTQGVTVLVRVGSIVGTATSAWAGTESREAEVVALAVRLRERIAGVLAGQIRSNPTQIPSERVKAPKIKPRLDRITLTAADVGKGAWQTSANYVRPDGIAAFERTIYPGCASPIDFVEHSIQIGRTAQGARQVFMTVSPNFTLAGRNIEQEAPGRAIALYGRASTQPVPIGKIGDERVVSRVHFRGGAVGNAQIVVAMIRVKRSITFLTIVGKPGKRVTTSYVKLIAARATSRVRAGLPGT